MSAHLSRSVTGNLLSSEYAPHITIQVNEAFRYVGNLQFLLSNEAQVDLIVFADLKGRQVTRMFIVQIDGFISGVGKTYACPTTPSLFLGEHSCTYDAQFQQLQEMDEAVPDSDFGPTDTFLTQQGYITPKHVIRERFVRILDEDARGELLFIYMEDVKYSGLGLNEVINLDASYEEWLHITHGLVERALVSFDITIG